MIPASLHQPPTMGTRENLLNRHTPLLLHLKQTHPPILSEPLRELRFKRLSRKKQIIREPLGLIPIDPIARLRIGMHHEMP